MSAAITYTEVARRHMTLDSVAPNGSSCSHDHWTTIVKRQDWADTPENGLYAGRSYRITERYVSTSPDNLGVLVNQESGPWSAVWNG